LFNFFFIGELLFLIYEANYLIFYFPPHVEVDFFFILLENNIFVELFLEIGSGCNSQCTEEYGVLDEEAPSILRYLLGGLFLEWI
jgi:hypothetical protein